MQIALIGYGKMGHEIRAIAESRGHSIPLIITEENKEDLNALKLQKVDVAIEFTAPSAAPLNVKKCMDAGIAVVSGTTGWNDKLPEARANCLSAGTSFIHASNFSLGVNIIFDLNRKLAKIMSRFDRYDVSVTEIHHTRKLDAPSGTAITIAEGILENYPAKTSWILNDDTDKTKLNIEAIREGDVPGTHQVKYSSDIDDIILTHEAHNRKGFALGAVLAAEYIAGKKGVFTMKDVLDLND